MQTFTFYKANVAPDAPDNSTTIQITETLPDCVLAVGTLETWQALEGQQARKLNDALRQSLPGGVYHRLLAVMMEAQASDWVVPVIRDNERA